MKPLALAVAIPLGIAVTLSAGCAADMQDDVASSTHNVEQAAVNGSYADATPLEFQTRLVPDDKKGLIIETSGDRFLFPMPREVRTFDTVDQIVAFAKQDLGASAILDDKSQELIGFRFTTSQVGSSYFMDLDADVLYRVADPVAAYLGGASGQVVVAGKPICMDGNDECASGLAGYLEPVAKPTDDISEFPTERNLCTTDRTLCAKYHTFWNRVDTCLMRYARHGSNTTITRGSTGERDEGYRVCSAGDPGAIPVPFIWMGRTSPTVHFCRSVLPAVQIGTESVFYSPHEPWGLGRWDIGRTEGTDVTSVERAAGGATFQLFGCGELFWEFMSTLVISYHDASRLSTMGTKNGL